MKKLIALFATLALPLLCAAQLRKDDNTVAIVAYWHPGDEVVLQSAMTRKQVSEDGSEFVNAQAVQTITLKVLEETETTYTVRISYSNVLDSATEGSIANEVSSAITSNMSYEIITNQFGQVQQIANAEQNLKAMRDKIPGLVDGVLARYDKKTIVEQGVDRDDYVKRFQGVFEDVAFISKNYNIYLLPLFRFHGNRFALDREYADEVTFYNVLDRGTLDLDMTYYFDSEETDAHSTLVESIAEADKEQMKPFAEALGMDDVDMTMQEVSSLTINLDTGWPDDLYNIRTVHLVDKETGEKMDLVWETGLTDSRNIE